MLILAGVSINAVVGDNGILSKAQASVYLQSIAVLEEFLQMEATNYALEENPYGTLQGLLKAKNPGWFYQNAQGYILDADGHVLYLIKKSGLPEDIQKQIRGGDASKVSQYYRQQDVYGVTSDLKVYYCNDGTSSILGLTLEDLDKDNPLEIAYDEDSLLAKVVNGVGEDGKATEALSTQDLKSIQSLTIDTVEKLALLTELKKLPALQSVNFEELSISSLAGIEDATSIKNVKFTNCTVSDYSALCGLTNLNKLYLVTPTGKNTDVATLCSSDKGIANAEFANLRYFGIYGYNTPLTMDAATDTRYSTTRYDITDISGLANLSTTTKQAIQYLSLPNLQLTNIASVVDFINVVYLRLDANALTTFDGIQNMSKLARIHAPVLYSNTASKYTFGSNETDSQNIMTDALSYIYKNEEGKNTNLKFLDLRYSSNLKYVSYLDICKGLTTLYLEGCTAIVDLSTISNTIAQCGSNYTVTGSAVKSIISPNSKVLNLSGLTLTTEEFEQIKNGTSPNTSLTHLSLADVKITRNGTQLTGTDLNEEINSVLKTCTAMQYLQLYNISDLSTIEFVKLEYDSSGNLIGGMPNIKELDLRKTSVRTNAGDKSLNGLELLNDLVKVDSSGNVTQGVRQMSVTGNNIDFYYIQPVVSSLNGSAYWYTGGYTHEGLWCNSWTSFKTLEKCTEITSLIMYWHSTQAFSYNASRILDLTNCTNLQYLTTCRFVNEMVLPSNLKKLRMDYDKRLPDVSVCSNLEELTIRFGSDESYTDAEYNEFLAGFNNLTKLKKLKMDGCEITDFTNLGLALPYMTQLETIDLEYYSWATIKNTTGLKDLSPLASAKSIPTLKSLTIAYADNCTNLDWISELEQLTTLRIFNTKISRVPDLSKMTKLTSVTLNNNRIADISGLEGVNSIISLNLENNALFDMSYTVAGTPYYTLAILSDLNQKQDGSLQKLYLAGNSIEDFSVLKDNNLQWDVQSGW